MASDFNNSPNMSMPVPAVSVAPGPEWATLLNSCLSIVDSHDHTTGKGVPITTGALNINADLTFNGFNAYGLRSTRFSAQGAPLSLATDLNCTYTSGVDLYYNDSNGNQIRLTANGAVAGTPGSIANLTPPASASYVSGNSTFVFQSAANTPANIDGASYILRNLTANSFGLTLSPPTAMVSNFTITLPFLPATTNFMQIDSSGNITNTIPISKGITAANIADGTIVTSLFATGSVTNSVIAAQTIQWDRLQTVPVGVTVALGGVATSDPPSTAGNFTNSTYTDLANATITITTGGRPVVLSLVPNSGTNFISASGTENPITIKFVNVTLATDVSEVELWSNGSKNYFAPNLFVLDFPAAGTYTYKVQYKAGTGVTGNINGIRLQVYEK